MKLVNTFGTIRKIIKDDLKAKSRARKRCYLFTDSIKVSRCNEQKTQHSHQRWKKAKNLIFRSFSTFLSVTIEIIVI